MNAPGNSENLDIADLKTSRFNGCSKISFEVPCITILSSFHIMCLNRRAQISIWHFSCAGTMKAIVDFSPNRTGKSRKKRPVEIHQFLPVFPEKSYAWNIFYFISANINVSQIQMLQQATITNRKWDAESPSKTKWSKEKKAAPTPKSSFQTFPEAWLYSRPLTCSRTKQQLTQELLIKLCLLQRQRTICTHPGFCIVFVSSIWFQGLCYYHK